MSFVLKLTGYDLSDEGPGRTVNEDATLVREDLGLFAVADGAGGRGRGDVAATLALRTIENYVGSTVRRSHDRPDRDILGIYEQAKRLSAAVHQAHRNILEVIKNDTTRTGMATTIVAALVAHRTNQIHIAHVGDSRCYRMRHGRLELLTTDDSITTDILELRPETPEEVLQRLPRNSVVRALGMAGELRVRLSTHDLLPDDQYLLCSDGLTSSVNTQTIWDVLKEGDPPNVVASELLNHALASQSHDNISVLTIECAEETLDDAVDTQRYAEVDHRRPSAPPTLALDPAPSSAELFGPEIVTASALLQAEPEFEPVEDWGSESDFPTLPLDREDLKAARSAMQRADLEFGAQTESLPKGTPPMALTEEEIATGTYSVGPDDFELFEEDDKSS